MDSKQHGHTPYVIILIQLMQAWKAEHGAQPKTQPEKEAFAALVRGGAKQEWGLELNFVEAFENAHKAYIIRETEYEVTEILADAKADDASLTPSSDNFWLLARALREFVAAEGGGQLPLSGALPDMTSATEPYIRLQEIYRKKAAADTAAVYARVQALVLGVCGGDAGGEAYGARMALLPTEEVTAFCKNAHDIRVLRTRSLEMEFAPAASGSSNLEEACEDVAMQVQFEPPPHDDQHPILWYVALRAADAFHARHGRFPGGGKAGGAGAAGAGAGGGGFIAGPGGGDGGGMSEAELEEDAAAVKALGTALLMEHSLEPMLTAFTDKHAAEVTRYGAAEIHNIAALVGGVAAQEAVKIIAHQYTPLNNTLIFNGIKSSMAVYEL
jgi:amyloid beta precursor protein binding protein 1